MRTAHDIIDDGLILFPTILDSDYRESRQTGMFGRPYSDPTFEPAWLEVPGTFWGEWSGTVGNRANHRWFANLLEDCAPDKAGRPDDADLILAAVSLHCGPYDDERVLIAYGVEIPPSLESVVTGLQGYPLIDDALMVKLEAEIFESDWANWLESDLRDATVAALVGEDNRFTNEAEDDAEAMIGSGDDLRALYEEVAAEAEESPWRVDIATNGTIPGRYRNGQHENGMTLLAEKIAALILRAHASTTQSLVLA